jgi:hypothetical protein
VSGSSRGTHSRAATILVSMETILHVVSSKVLEPWKLHVEWFPGAERLPPVAIRVSGNERSRDTLTSKAFPQYVCLGTGWLRENNG